MNGIIFSLHDADSFVLLQLKNGALEFTVNDGAGSFTKTRKDTNILDGEWHSIVALKQIITRHSHWKKLFALSLIVDDEVVTNVFGLSTGNDIEGVLYLGGNPTFSKKADAFNGCIRNVKFDNANMPLLIPSGPAVGDVRVGFCSLCKPK